MSETSQACPKCGGTIGPDAPQGLCPKCLLQQASFPTETGAGTRHGRLMPPTREELAAAFPHLEILELIGQGGMGFVFKARQPKLDRTVALKILAQPLAEQTSFAERFTREGRTLAKLNHPNIVTIHDFGQAGSFFYLLMEFVDGVNLRKAMRAGAFTAQQALAVVPRICDALQYAHNEGVLHRDIKPDNILLDTRGRVKIADFGIAKLMAEVALENPLTGTGSSLGTPHYMAPEQIERPNAVDHRADIFSLGVVFYEMLTGELPLGRFAPPSEKSGSDPRLDQIVFQTLEKQPEKRPQSADEVKTRVENVGSANPPPPSQTKPSLFRNRRRQAAFVTAAIVLCALLLSAFFFFRSRNPAPGDYQRALEALRDEHVRRQNVEPRDPARALKADTLTRYERTITLRSTNTLFADEKIRPVIRYADGPWVTNEATTHEENWAAAKSSLEYSWTLPEPFTPGFDVMAALERTRFQFGQQPIPLFESEVVPLFSATNGFGQIISGGLEYIRSARPLAADARAEVSFQDVSPGRKGFVVTLEGQLPEGAFLQGEYAQDPANGAPTVSVLANNRRELQMWVENWTLVSNPQTTRWTHPIHLLKDGLRGKKWTLALDTKTEIFSVTNYVYRQPQGVLPSASSSIIATNEAGLPEIDWIMRGYLELKRKPARP